MNIADILIIVLAATAGYFGVRRGTITLLCGVLGVLGGVFIASFLYDKLAFLTQNSTIRTIVLTAILLGAVLLVSDLLVVFGRWLQRKALKFSGTLPDKIGSVAVASVGSVVMLWLVAAIFGIAAPQSVRAQLENSLFFTSVAKYTTLPSSVSSISQLLRPFASPDVFVGQEPDFGNASAIHRTYEDLDQAAAITKASIVKITAWGCGSISSGSGFIVGSRYVATNAHVVAGSDRISIQNGDVSFTGKLVWFDPKLDFALLATEGDLTGSVLTISPIPLEAGAIAAVLGYSQGAGLVVGDAIILQRLQADGYDIYRQQKVVRSVYALRGDVVAGNSGGPAINSKGEVVGIVFGHSTYQNRTGYVLTVDQIASTIQTARNLRDVVSTGPCAAG